MKFRFIHAPCIDDSFSPHWRSYPIRASEDSMLSSLTAHEVATSILSFAIVDMKKRMGRSTVGENDEARRTYTARSVEKFWLEAQATNLDRSQRLEDHLDTMILITSFGLKNLSMIVPANDARLCSLCVQDLVKGAGIENGVVPKTTNSAINTNINLLGQDKHLASSIRAAAQRPGIIQPISCQINTANCNTVSTGFELIRISERPVVLSKNRKTYRVLDLISEYDARTAHYLRSNPRIQNTCTWMFNDPDFLKWRKTPGSAVLSCIGTGTFIFVTRHILQADRTSSWVWQVDSCVS